MPEKRALDTGLEARSSSSSKEVAARGGAARRQEIRCDPASAWGRPTERPAQGSAKSGRHDPEVTSRAWRPARRSGCWRRNRRGNQGAGLRNYNHNLDTSPRTTRRSSAPPRTYQDRARNMKPCAMPGIKSAAAEMSAWRGASGHGHELLRKSPPHAPAPCTEQKERCHKSAGEGRPARRWKWAAWDHFDFRRTIAAGEDPHAALQVSLSGVPQRNERTSCRRCVSWPARIHLLWRENLTNAIRQEHDQNLFRR